MPETNGREDNSLRHPFGELDIREVIAIAKDSNIDPSALIEMAKNMSLQMHKEHMRYWDLREQKMKMDFAIAQKNQDYALFLSVFSITVGGLVSYLMDPWAGVAIATMGTGVAGIATGKRLLSKSKATIGEQATSSVDTMAS